MKRFLSFLFFILLFNSLVGNTTSNENNGTDRTPKRRLKILVYSPTIGWSHMQFMGTVADTLVEAGRR